MRKTGRFYQVTGQEGLLVISSYKESRYKKAAEIMAGDFIIAMDGIKVESLAQFKDYLKERTQVLLRVRYKADTYRYVLWQKKGTE